MNLTQFLDKKGVEYALFDPLRFKNFYAKHKNYFSNLPKIVQIVGTNGKGTTGRFLAQILKNSGQKVGHFTSPHIMSFTERFWLDGHDISMGELEECHKKLISFFKDEIEALSYFEYLTLLCIVLFRDKADILVLEAGVGGEFDSTSVLPKQLLLLTNIGLDHQEMLGNSLGEIVSTKLRAANCPVIIGLQSSDEVYEIIKDGFADFEIYFLKDILSPIKWQDISKKINESGLAKYLSANLALAFATAEYLGIKLPNLDGISQVKGRFERIVKNIVVDVGHNALAAEAVQKELGNKKVVLIFNCFLDKEPQSVLEVLKESIKRVEIIEVNHERVIRKEELTKILDRIGLGYCDFVQTKDDEEYLVFGSFSVVCEFLRRRA